MSTKQTTATINGIALQVPAKKSHRIRAGQATFDTKAGASISNGDKITITDNNPTTPVTVVGEFRSSGSGSSDFDIAFTGIDGADDVATAFVEAFAQYNIDTDCVGIRAQASGATVTLTFHDAGLPASNDTPKNTSGTPIENITTFEDDTDPLPPEEITAGIAAPSSAPSASPSPGGSLSGDFYYIFSYYDIYSDEDSPNSDPSAQVSPDGTTNGTVTITFGAVSSAAPARATHIKVWRTTDGSTTDFRWLAQVPVGTATYEDTTADGTLSPVALSALIQTVPDLDDAVAFAGRIWGIKGTTVRWSEGNSADKWSPIPYGGEFIPGADNITLSPMGDALVVYKAASIHIVDYDNIDPAADLQISNAYFGKGALNKKCVTISDGRHFVLDANGVYMYEDLTRITELSGPIAPFIDRFNLDVSEKFSAVATRDRYRFFAALDDDTECQWCFTLDLATFRATGFAHWWPQHFDHEIADSSLFTFASSAGVDQLAQRTVACVMDTKANVYMMDWLTTDGAPSNLLFEGTVTAIDNSGASGVGRITHAETRGFTEDWGGTTYNALGLHIRFIKPDGSFSESFQITAVTSNVLVELDRAFTATELTDFATATFYVGTIHTIFDSKEFTYNKHFLGKKVEQAIFSIDPSPYDFTLDFFRNADKRGAEYMQATADDGYYKTTSGDEGAEVRVGGDNDEAGYGVSKVPLGSESFNSLQFRVEGWRPGRPYRINEISLELEEISEELSNG